MQQRESSWALSLLDTPINDWGSDVFGLKLELMLQSYIILLLKLLHKDWIQRLQNQDHHSSLCVQCLRFRIQSYNFQTFYHGYVTAWSAQEHWSLGQKARTVYSDSTLSSVARVLYKALTPGHCMLPQCLCTQPTCSPHDAVQCAHCQHTAPHSCIMPDWKAATAAEQQLFSSI